jgi:hypothetical protein
MSVSAKIGFWMLDVVFSILFLRVMLRLDRRIHRGLPLSKANFLDARFRGRDRSGGGLPLPGEQWLSRLVFLRRSPA